jgi:hypothetical protein
VLRAAAAAANLGKLLVSLSGWCMSRSIWIRANYLNAGTAVVCRVAVVLFFFARLSIMGAFCV